MKRGLAGAGVLVVAALVLGACGSSSTTTTSSPSTPTAPKLVVAPGIPKPGAITLSGAGANSIAPFFEKVFYDYEQTASPKVTVNYSPAGSSVGIRTSRAEHRGLRGLRNPHDGQ